MRATRKALLILGALLTTPAHAELIAAEFFNGYGTSEILADEQGLQSTLTGGIGWDDAWYAGDKKYVPGTSLSYSATGYDNSGNLDGTGDGAFAYAGNLNPGNTPYAIPSTIIRDFTTASQTLWISALISIDETWDRAILWIDANTTDGQGNDFVGVLDNNIHMRYDGTNLATAGTPATGTHLLLVKVELDVSGANDRLSFWFDPDLSSGESGLGTATYTDDSSDTFGSSIDGIGVLLVNRDSDGSGGYVTDSDTEVENGELIDAILVGTTFDNVIAPPPAALEITSITKTGNTVTIGFTGAEGASYGLNKSTNLDFTTPDIVDTTSVSGGSGTLEDTGATEDAAFYRVESQ